MTTKTSMPPSKVAQRSKVQKTFVSAKLLSGFTDTNHFRMLTGEYLASLSADKRQRFEDEANAARQYVAGLAPITFANAELQPITGAYVDAIKLDPVFQRTFGMLPYRFAEVDLKQLIALQPWVEPRHDKVPKNKKKLLEFALPRKWDVPTEVSVIQPQGPIQVLTSDPALQNMEMEFDQATGKISLAASKHPNLIQVAHLAGRYCLRNGYHRVVDALEQGRQTLPALVWDSITPDQIALPGHGMFTIQYVFSIPRPPLVCDFATPAATLVKVRERRYGMIINLDIKPINFGI